MVLVKLADFFKIQKKNINNNNLLLLHNEAKNANFQRLIQTNRDQGLFQLQRPLLIWGISCLCKLYRIWMVCLALHQ